MPPCLQNPESTQEEGHADVITKDSQNPHHVRDATIYQLSEAAHLDDLPAWTQCFFLPVQSPLCIADIRCKDV